MHQTPDDLDMFVHRQLTRRQLVGGVVATLASAGLATKAGSADVPADPARAQPEAGLLPRGHESEADGDGWLRSEGSAAGDTLLIEFLQQRRG